MEDLLLAQGFLQYPSGRGLAVQAYGRPFVPELIFVEQGHTRIGITYEESEIVDIIDAIQILRRS